MYYFRDKVLQNGVCIQIKNDEWNTHELLKCITQCKEFNGDQAAELTVTVDE
jgi:hypothetical protein